MLAERLRSRGVNASIIERVERLNVATPEGHRLRGIHYKWMSDPQLEFDLVRLGECHRRFGRAWVEAIPRNEIRKRGRRKFVTREFILDNTRWPDGQDAQG